MQTKFSDSAIDQVKWLVDREDISETLYLYATGIDTKDFTLFRSIFADEVEVDFSTYSDLAPSWTKMTGDAWGDRRTIFYGLEATQHTLSNLRIAIDGDAATVVAYMQAAHYLNNTEGSKDYVIGGFYTFDLKRHGPARWKIHRVKLTVTWQVGNKQIMSLAMERAEKMIAEGIEPKRP
jgi:hypothetical protein